MNVEQRRFATKQCHSTVESRSIFRDLFTLENVHCAHDTKNYPDARNRADLENPLISRKIVELSAPETSGNRVLRNTVPARRVYSLALLDRRIEIRCLRKSECLASVNSILPGNLFTVDANILTLDRLIFMKFLSRRKEKQIKLIRLKLSL